MQTRTAQLLVKPADGSGAAGADEGEDEDDEATAAKASSRPRKTALIDRLRVHLGISAPGRARVRALVERRATRRDAAVVTTGRSCLLSTHPAYPVTKLAGSKLVVLRLPVRPAAAQRSPSQHLVRFRPHLRSSFGLSLASTSTRQSPCTRSAERTLAHADPSSTLQTARLNGTRLA